MSVAQYLKAISKHVKIMAVASVFAGAIFSAAATPFVLAAVQNPTSSAKVSFTFDDGLVSAVNQAAPTLQKYGFSGTDYVITGCVGMNRTPNTCHANTSVQYMTWSQIKKLQSTYGWEIGSHSDTHPYLATKDASDGQPKVLTPAQVTAELVNSKNKLAAQGISATDFSTPYGDYNNAVLAQIAKYYASHRGFADEGNNVWPNNDYLLYDMRVQEGVSVAQVKQRIDQAITNNQWLILTFHNIKTVPKSNPDDYEYSVAELDQIAAYVKSKQNAGLVHAVTVNQGLVTSTSNLLPNSSFNNGISSGWTTDSPTTITNDTGTNGSFPDPKNSIKLVSSPAKETHLFSPKVAVTPGATYMLKSFLNVAAITSGQVAFYIDEYDASGNWISGQYRKAENSAFVENLNFTYSPSNPSVATASLQIIVAGSGITAYVDNIQWFVTQESTVTKVNLFKDSSFEQGLGTWTTDAPLNATSDSTSKGSPANPRGSIKLTASTTQDVHVFSPLVAIDPAKHYTLTNYLNLQALSAGEVAYYIDEYDMNGNWISGQYKLGLHSPSATDASFAYTPSSAYVKSASLQVIVQKNSGAIAYFDNARWYEN